MADLPKDPAMLLSIVNMKLRDFYPSLDVLCDDLEIEKERFACRCPVSDMNTTKDKISLSEILRRLRERAQSFFLLF